MSILSLFLVPNFRLCSVIGVLNLRLFRKIEFLFNWDFLPSDGRRCATFTDEFQLINEDFGLYSLIVVKVPQRQGNFIIFAGCV